MREQTPAKQHLARVARTARHTGESELTRPAYAVARGGDDLVGLPALRRR